MPREGGVTWSWDARDFPPGAVVSTFTFYWRSNDGKEGERTIYVVGGQAAGARLVNHWNSWRSSIFKYWY